MLPSWEHGPGAFFWKSFWKRVDILFVWWYNNIRVKKGITEYEKNLYYE